MASESVSAAAMPLELNGKTFRASPLTDRDHDELDLWVQARIIKIARMSCDGSMTKEEKREFMAEAFDQASRYSWTNELGQKFYSKVDGAAKLAWQMIHHNHPDVTYEELRPLVGTESLENISVVFGRLHLSNEEAEEVEKEASKK